MAKLTGSYEVMIVISLANGDDAVTAISEKFRSLIEANGTVVSVDEWGKRRLAYAIEDEREGYYLLINFESKPDFPAELDRILKITDGILRSMITVK